MKPAMRACGAANPYTMHFGAVSPVVKTVANFQINFQVNIASARTHSNSSFSLKPSKLKNKSNRLRLL